VVWSKVDRNTDTVVLQCSAGPVRPYGMLETLWLFPKAIPKKLLQKASWWRGFNSGTPPGLCLICIKNSELMYTFYVIRGQHSVVYREILCGIYTCMCCPAHGLFEYSWKCELSGAGSDLCVVSPGAIRCLTLRFESFSIFTALERHFVHGRHFGNSQEVEDCHGKRYVAKQECTNCTWNATNSSFHIQLSSTTLLLLDWTTKDPAKEEFVAFQVRFPYSCADIEVSYSLVTPYWESEANGALLSMAKEHHIYCKEPYSSIITYHIHIHVHTHTCKHAHAQHAHLYTHVHTHTHTHNHSYIYIFINLSSY